MSNIGPKLCNNPGILTFSHIEGILKQYHPVAEFNFLYNGSRNCIEKLEEVELHDTLGADNIYYFQIVSFSAFWSLYPTPFSLLKKLTLVCCRSLFFFS